MAEQSKEGVMKKFPMLYGISSTGAVKQWLVEVYYQDNDEYATLVVTHGQHNGKLQTSPKKIKGKNIGRANETTPYQQAVSEAESLWTKQKDKNYTEEFPLIDKGMGKIAPNMLPMLALKYEDRKHDLVWPVYVQPKFNGVRCLIKRESEDVFTFNSRKGKQYRNLEFMHHELKKFMSVGDILDGELYNHGEISFQQLVSLLKEEKNPNHTHLERYVKFYNYDIVSNKGFKDRSENLLWDDMVYLKAVRTVQAFKEQDIIAFHQEVVAQGYEGVIVRSGGNEPYRFQYRSPALLKYKEFQDEEFEIIGGKEGVGKDEGQCIFRCTMKNGLAFDVKCKGPNSVRIEQWKNMKSYIGKMLTVRFQSYTDEGKPLFPVGIAVRDYE